MCGISRRGVGLLKASGAEKPRTLWTSLPFTSPKRMNTFQLDLLSASDLNPKAPAFVPRTHATPVTSLVQSDDEDFEFGQQIGWALDQEDALRNGLYTPPRKPQGSTNSRAHQRHALPSVSGWAHHQRY